MERFRVGDADEPIPLHRLDRSAAEPVDAPVRPEADEQGLPSSDLQQDEDA